MFLAKWNWFGRRHWRLPQQLPSQEQLACRDPPKMAASPSWSVGAVTLFCTGMATGERKQCGESLLSPSSFQRKLPNPRGRLALTKSSHVKSWRGWMCFPISAVPGGDIIWRLCHGMSTKTCTLRPSDLQRWFCLAQIPLNLLMPQFLMNIFLLLFIQPIYVGVYLSYSEDVHLLVVQSVHFNQRFFCICRLDNNN